MSDFENDEFVRAKIFKYKTMLFQEKIVGKTLGRLAKLPMNLELLSETDIGKCVNQMRNHPKFGNQAQKIVDVWKEIAQKSGVYDVQKPDSKIEERNEKEVLKKKELTKKKKLLKSDRSKCTTTKISHINSTAKSTEINSFEAILMAGDCVKQNSPKKSLDSTKYSNKFDPNYQSKNLLNYHPIPISEKKYAQNQKSEDLPILYKAKNNPTKVYAGKNKTACKNDGNVLSLFDLCMRTICDNVDAIDDTGDIPFDILKPALQKCTASQLFFVEQRNSYLIEDSDRLWEMHCKREFKNGQANQDEMWRDCYQRLTHERQQKLEMLSCRIERRKKEALNPVRKAKLADAKAPRDVERKQAKNGTAVVALIDAVKISSERRKMSGKTSHPTASLTLNDSSQIFSKKRPKKQTGFLMIKARKMFNEFQR